LVAVVLVQKQAQTTFLAASSFTRLTWLATSMKTTMETTMATTMTIWGDRWWWTSFLISKILLQVAVDLADLAVALTAVHLTRQGGC
jgi:hypothetical protein